MSDPSGTKVRTIVTLVPAEHGRYRLKLRHLTFDPYPSRTRTGPLNFETMEMIRGLKIQPYYNRVPGEVLVIYLCLTIYERDYDTMPYTLLLPNMR